MFWRDRTRLADLRVRMNECPLGSAALAGTTYPIDRDFTSRQLGFSGGPCRNSIDAVSDRDFILEFMSVSSILAVHLSRLGEEIVTWCTSQFGFAQVAEDLSAGSSIMPQKRNPDAAELLRAKSGRVIGHLVSLHTVMKGLPMAYSRDMQEDKESAFDVADTVRLCVRVADRLLGTLTFNPTRMRSEAARSNSVATDLADWLVTFRQMPFRDAHHIVGRVVQRLESEGLDLATVSLLRLAEMEPQLSGLSPQLLTPENAVAARTSFGGTAPANVRSQAIRLGELNSSL
jgi:argininosuccinate lyase